MPAYLSTRRRPIVVAICLGLLVVALGALTASAATITITPANPQGWITFGNSGGGSSAITTTAPRSGDGSVEMTGDRTRWIKAVDPLAPAELGDLYDVTDFAFDWMVAVGSTSNLGANYTPALRLHVYDPNAANPFSELIWEGAYNGPVTVTQGSWVSTDMVGDSQLLWRFVTGPGVTLDGGGAQVNQPLSAWQNATWYSTDAVVFGISVGAGSSVGAGYHAFGDNLVLGFNSAPDTFNFEPNPQCTTVCYADAVGGNDANGGTSPADAKKTIQAAIDAVSAGGEVRVLPGSYDQDEKNSVDPVTGGAGANDFNIFVNKANLTIQGVTAADVDITTAAGALATIKPKRNVPNFGSSAMFIQADGVTVQGLKFVSDNGASYADKTVEIIGNDATIDAVAFDVTGGAVGIYISDFSYDSGTDTSTVPDYAFTNSLYTSTNQTGLAVQAASGAGWPDNVGTRTISGNTFTNLDDAVVFAGAGSAGWRLYPVGSADITGNTFSQIKRRHVLAYGNYPIVNPASLGYGDLDWCGIIAGNIFDKGTMLWQGTTQCPTGQPRRWDAASGNPAPYDFFRNVAGIYSAIQQYGVGKAVPGDLLEVFSGTYVEQVTVDKSMTLLGAGQATTFIKAPATIPVASDPNSVIVKITGAGVNVDISGFTVTGPGPSGCGSIGFGIVVRDAAFANIHDNHIVDVRDQPISGCQNGSGIQVGRNAWATSGTADITDNVISGYQKNGITVDGPGSSANIEGNTITGAGSVSFIAQNGIQISRGATAEVNDNTVSGHSYTPFTATSTGMLLYQAGTTNTDGNTLQQNQIGINIIDTSGAHDNNIITATSAGTGSPGFWGIVVDAPPPTRLPSPLDGQTAAGLQSAQSPAPNPPIPIQTVTVTGNQFTSDGSTGGVGLETDAGYGSFNIDLTATKNYFQNWDYGVVVYECQTGCTGTTFVNVDINRNSITDNVSFGLYNDTLTPITDATCNWWNAADGPSDQGPGSGDAVGVDTVFTPWLYTDDLDGPCFFGGTITVVKQAGDVGEQFEFDPSWSATNFFLYSGGALTSDPLQPGNYSVSEVNLPPGWSQQSAVCVNEANETLPTAPPSNIPVEDYDEWVCTFTNVYSPPPANICPAEYQSNLWTDIIGKGMGSTKKHKTVAKLNLPNYLSIDTLYGQLVAKDAGSANYVRFILPGKNNYVQVNTITSPADHIAGNFWYGDYIDPAKSVSGRWFLQKSGVKNHIPRAFVLYPTYADPDDTYVNVWETFDASEGEVYWDTAVGWTQQRVITVPIAPPNGATTFSVELAVVDNDKDARQVWVTVEAGGVSQTQKPAGPSAGDELNLMTFNLSNVPAGTDEITITMYSPSLTEDGVTGDSATLVGMTGRYVCAPLGE